MKIVWVFLIITFTGDRTEVLVSLQFGTEKECRAHEQTRAILNNTAMGCLPAAIGDLDVPGRIGDR